MKKDNAGNYIVTAGEEISIVVKPVGVGAFIAVAENGRPVAPVNPPVTFSFRISEDVHFAKIACRFMGDEKETAHYKVTIKGSKGGSFEKRPIKKTDPLKERVWTFLQSE
jgi:hypothetical protein